MSRVAPGRFRIEEFVGLLPLPDLPDEIGMGWIIEAGELDDGRLQVRGILEDPNIESVSGFPIPPTFAQSSEFEVLSAAIDALDGNWEVVFHGLFSAYVPKDRAQERGFSLAGDLNKALRDWVERGRTV